MNAASVTVLLAVLAFAALAVWRCVKKGAPCECGCSGRECSCGCGGGCHCCDEE